MQFLLLATIIDLHKDLITTYSGHHGIRDQGLLESAIAYPQLLFSIGVEHNIYTLAASYCFHLIKNHPFIDGNKRIGILAMLTFLRTNGESCKPRHKELYNLAIRVATSNASEEEIANFCKYICKE